MFRDINKLLPDKEIVEPDLAQDMVYKNMETLHEHVDILYALQCLNQKFEELVPASFY